MKVVNWFSLNKSKSHIPRLNWLCVYTTFSVPVLLKLVLDEYNCVLSTTFLQILEFIRDGKTVAELMSLGRELLGKVQ